MCEAHLIAMGFSLVKGIDYKETFELVVNMDTIKLALSLEIASKCGLDHMDVKNAFLHGYLEEEIYIE